MSSRGTLYFLIGKMGAGKSTYSYKLADETGAILISEDEWLAKLFPDEINNLEDFIARHKRLLTVMKPHVKQLLNSGSSVIMDFPGNTIETREWFLSVAKSADAPHTAVYLKASDEKCLAQIARRRIEQPHRAKYDTPELFQQVTQYFEEPSEAEGLNIQVVENLK